MSWPPAVGRKASYAHFQGSCLSVCRGANQHTEHTVSDGPSLLQPRQSITSLRGLAGVFVQGALCRRQIPVLEASLPISPTACMIALLFPITSLLPSATHYWNLRTLTCRSAFPKEKRKRKIPRSRMKKLAHKCNSCTSSAW